ncbi:amino acid permease-like protein [Perkinsela sp. CCAP 1560/4]|nr:amino acid permease-like protein [Perkinsela sp. CCAP 1560/4]|eukprot:KNH09546.1 amino acid permease-like protein [Perkinsela sp. CCAP 1560/4]
MPGQRDRAQVTAADPTIECENVEEENLHGTTFSTAITVLCNVIGGGVLALSCAYHYTSLVYGVFFLLYIGFLSLLSMILLVIMAYHTKEYTYMGLARCAFEGIFQNRPELNQKLVGSASGKKGYSNKGYMSAIVEGAVLLYTFGCAVMYIVVIGDSMGPLAKSWMRLSGFYASEKFWIVVTAPILFVLSSARKITELKVSSIIAFITILYVGVVVAIRYGEEAYRQASVITASDRRVRVATVTKDLPKAIPLLTVCFGMHYNIPPLFHELRNRSVPKMKRALIPAFAVIVSLYLEMGILGYLHFGPDVTKHGGDILAQFSHDDLLVNIGRFVMLLHFACVYPLLAIGCRRSLNLFLFKGDASVSTLVRVSEALAIVTLSSILAAFSSGISQVLAFNGSLFGLHIIMTFPALMYAKIFRDTLRMREKVLIVVLFVSGILFSIAGSVAHICAIASN